MFVAVAIDLALDKLFTYSVDGEMAEKLRVGQLLRVPFGGRIVRGFAMRISDNAPLTNKNGKKIVYRPIIAIEDESPFFSVRLLELAEWIAGYTLSPIELVLRAAVPAAVLKPNARPKELLYVEVAKDFKATGLSKRQLELVNNISRVGGGWLRQIIEEFGTTAQTIKKLAEQGALSLENRQMRRNPLAGRQVMATQPMRLNDEQATALQHILSTNGKPVLLHGVTGSGKTEVYLQAIGSIINAGKSAIVLVPEIALTPQTVSRFAARFGNRIAVLHSALSDGERYDEWHRIRRGDAQVVVGPRSAVFAPVRNLGLIVVDEEHDFSYKQEDAPRYNARDVAVLRAKMEGAIVVLGSATPSLETWHNVRIGKYTIAEMKHRVMNRPMPTVTIVDMEYEKSVIGKAGIFSNVLMDAIRKRLLAHEQTILFLNRRGYSRSLECPECGYVEECPDCSAAYTYHVAGNCLRCHICGGWKHPPERCPNCGAPDFRFAGVGTQRAEMALAKCFPDARVLRMDADSTSRKNSHDDLLSAFRAHEADILIGTQMIAKGLDFPNVTLVGVINADTSLNMPDFRAAERTFQLLAQVSGRAGRADLPGQVFIQTFKPSEVAVAAAAKDNGFHLFAEQELLERKAAKLPPYYRLTTLLFRSLVEDQARKWCEYYAKALMHYAKVKSLPLEVSEAMPAALERAKQWYRYQIVLRAPKTAIVAAAVRWITAAHPVPKDVALAIDVDAVNLM